MHQFRPSILALLLGAIGAVAGVTAHAQDLFKWVDADGKVHYGDRASAPESSKRINVPAAPQRLPLAAPPAPVSAQKPPPLPPQFDPAKKSVAVAPSRVGAECKGLADRIAAVPAGQPWPALSQQFNSACPGIAYECVEFKSTPENNQCTWIERVGNTMLNVKRYP